MDPLGGQCPPQRPTNDAPGEEVEDVTGYGFGAELEDVMRRGSSEEVKYIIGHGSSGGRGVPPPIPPPSSHPCDL